MNSRKANHGYFSAIVTFTVSAILLSQAAKSQEFVPDRDPTEGIVFVHGQLNAQNGDSSICDPLWNGTGFVVSQSGYILTAAHLIPDPREGYDRVVTISRASVVTKPSTACSNTSYEQVKVLHIDKGDDNLRNDVAILRDQAAGAGVSWHPLCLGDSRRVSSQTSAWVFGFGIDTVYRAKPQGTISTTTDDQFWSGFLHAGHGDSGAPVLNKQGEVVGLISGASGNDPELNFFVPIHRARSAMTRVNIDDQTAACKGPTPTVQASALAVSPPAQSSVPLSSSTQPFSCREDQSLAWLAANDLLGERSPNPEAFADNVSRTGGDRRTDILSRSQLVAEYNNFRSLYLSYRYSVRDTRARIVGETCELSVSLSFNRQLRANGRTENGSVIAVFLIAIDGPAPKIVSQRVSAMK